VKGLQRVPELAQGADVPTMSDVVEQAIRDLAARYGVTVE
jgi:hypothetical protein